MVSTEIKDNFPYPTIPKFPGRPDFDAIAAVHTKLKANAASIHSNLGGGNHGLLGLALQPGTYTILTGHVFQPPDNPGPTANIPNGLTGPQISELVREHEAKLKLWKLYTQVEQTLKQQLITAFDDIYLSGLRNRHTGFAGLTLLTMLQHLYDSYGDLTPTELEDNDERMRSAYDATEPIETLYNQIEQAVDIAEAGQQPYTNAQILTRAYTLILQTGLLDDACRDWDDKTTTQKTWASFKVHFAKAHKKLRQQQATASKTGMHAANAVLESIQNDATQAIQELSNATMADRNHISELINANQATQTNMKSIHDSIKLLQAQVTMLMTATIQGQGSNNNPRRTRDPNSPWYCWTHGRTFSEKHQSPTCRNRKEGHQEAATLHNKMGGSTKNCT